MIQRWRNLRAAIPEGMPSNYDLARARGKKGIALVRNLPRQNEQPVKPPTEVSAKPRRRNRKNPVKQEMLISH